MWFQKKKPSLNYEDLVEMYESIPSNEDRSTYIWVVPKRLEKQFKSLIGKQFTYCLWNEEFLGCRIQPAGYGYGNELNLISREQKLQAAGYSWTGCR